MKVRVPLQACLHVLGVWIQDTIGSAFLYHVQKGRDVITSQHNREAGHGTDADERLIRVIKHDCVERDRTPQMVLDRYQETLKPMHELYIEPSKRYADLIIPQGGGNNVAIKLLTDYIRSLLP